MCGICGKMNFDGSVVDRDLIDRMCRTIVHRGPDDQGIYTGPHVGLGQRRLSIIDLSSNAVAPLANEDRSIWVVFNGEIYNFQELRRDLVARGHVFETGTDTEVIVHLYEEYGTDCLAKMRGMFAFALWDSRTQTLFAARDRLGKKPFFYTRTPRAFVFGSEIKAVTADPEVEVAPDYRAIDLYLTYQYVPSPLSAFAGISKLPPGHFLVCRADGSLEVRRYWSPPRPAKIRSSPAEIERELLRRLDEAVALRMISDVPLGAFLSGGIDSGTIVALMARHSNRPVKTFSIGFEEDAFNELPYARQLAERYGTEHHEFLVRPDAAEVLPLLVRHYNEPFADSSALPTYYVSKMTRQYVTVALSGDGGDENFSGYDRYGQMARWTRLDRLPLPVRRSMAGVAVGTLGRLPYSNTGARMSRAFQMLGSRQAERYLLWMKALKPQEQRMAYSPQFRALIQEGPPAVDPVAALTQEPGEDPLDWMMRHDENFYLPDCLMVKTDIAAMANSLEVRCPFIDHEFMEFTASIPSTLKRDGSGGKLILKHAVKDLLPEELLHKPKSGFGIPLARWFGGEWMDLLRGTLTDDRCLNRGLFEPGFLRKLIDEQVEGTKDWSNRLWAFLILEMWFREFID